MAQLQKIIKVTQEQYNTLQNGGTVGSYTGINANYIYLVEDSSEGDSFNEFTDYAETTYAKKSQLPTFTLSGTVLTITDNN